MKTKADDKQTCDNHVEQTYTRKRGRNGPFETTLKIRNATIVEPFRASKGAIVMERIYAPLVAFDALATDV